MGLKLVTPPAVEPVSLAELKAQLAFTSDLGTADDVILARKIKAARQHVERTTGRAIVSTTYDFMLDRFPHAEIEIPRGPLASVVSVKYVAPGGAETTVSADNYAVDDVSDAGWIVPVAGFSWPTAMETVNAVRVRFIAGQSVENVPDDLKEAILQLAAWWYEQREAALVDGAAREVPFGVQDILNGHREWTF